MKLIHDTLNEISSNFNKLSKNCSTEIHTATVMIINSLNNGGKIIFCGNGGSAADAQHLAAEFIVRLRPLAAISLTTDTSAITAIGNDFSFEEIFSRQIEAIGKKEDILYAISTSGNSLNVIKAIEQARYQGIKTIGVTGIEGNKMRNMCDLTISAPAKRPDRIQEMHIAVGQIICEIVEKE